MNICIFDTETTSLEKPFCYNIGYCIVDAESREVLLQRDYIVEQIWHNLELFNSAYYANKRQLYINSMKARKTIMEKWGYITQQMTRDFKNFEVENSFAFNSPFDSKVFDFNTDWYKTIHPFDNIKIFDIRAYAHNRIAFTDKFKDFCEQHQCFTDSGNYSTTAETLYQYILGDINFKEEHTALADSLIEKDILFYCLDCGAELFGEYKVYASVPRLVDKELIVVQDSKETIFTYQKKTSRGNKIFLK